MFDPNFDLITFSNTSFVEHFEKRHRYSEVVKIPLYSKEEDHLAISQMSNASLLLTQRNMIYLAKTNSTFRILYFS